MADSITMIGAFVLGVFASSFITQICYRRAMDKPRKRTPGAGSVNHESPALSHRMKALLVCHSPEITAIFSQLFREISVEVERCDSAPQALSLLSSKRFAALVLDFDGLSSCTEIARSVRERAITVFAVASENRSKSFAFAAGSTFVVEQPLIPEQIRALLRSAYGRMLRGSQAYFRLNFEVPVFVAREAGPVLRCATVNLSQSGMALKTPTPFQPSEKLHLVFALPDSNVVMSAEGVVIWDDGRGKAGIRLAGSSLSDRDRYFEWLHDHFFLPFDQPPPVPDVPSASYAK